MSINRATLRKELQSAIGCLPTAREWARSHNKNLNLKLKLRYEKERNLSLITEAKRQAERAEAAEAKLREWEAAAANNDPYVTNGGYVEVEVLEAVKRRNAELLRRAEAAEAMIEEIRRHVPVTDFAQAQYRAQWLVMAKDAKRQQEAQP